MELTYLFFCKAKLLPISHLFMYFIHFSWSWGRISHCESSGNTPSDTDQIQQVPLTSTYGQEFWVCNQFNVYELGLWREAKEAGKKKPHTDSGRTHRTQTLHIKSPSQESEGGLSRCEGTNCSSWIITVYLELSVKFTTSVAVCGLESCTV